MAPHPATGVASDRLSCAIYPVAAPSPQRPGRLPPARRSALVPPVSVALNALAPDRSVPVRVQPTVAPLKPCEPARYPPLQVERMLLIAAQFTPMADLRRGHVLGAAVVNATRFAGAAPTKSPIPTRWTRGYRCDVGRAHADCGGRHCAAQPRRGRELGGTASGTGDDLVGVTALADGRTLVAVGANGKVLRSRD